MEVSASMVPLAVLVDPVVDLEVCCMVNSVVIRLVVLVEVEDVEVKVDLSGSEKSSGQSILVMSLQSNSSNGRSSNSSW